MTKSTGQRRQWTEDDMVEARRLYRDIKSYKGVAIKMRRSPTTIRERLLGTYRVEMRRNEIEPNELITVPQEVLDAREYRNQLCHRDITAALMGDPLPGQSYYDKVAMRAETRAG